MFLNAIGILTLDDRLVIKLDETLILILIDIIYLYNKEKILIVTMIDIFEMNR